MTRLEVIKKLEDALSAIQEYKKEGLNRATYDYEREQIQKVKSASHRLLIEAKTIGAAGETCPTCNGSGRL